jgi:hypothetical protein
MKPSLNLKIEDQLEELSQILGKYRKKHGSGCHPSRDIWDQAIALCEHAPLAQVARGIGVSATGLWNQQKTRHCESKKVPKTREPQFLEIGLDMKDMMMVSQSSSAPNKTQFSRAEGSRYVELQRPDGSCLRISDLNAHGLDLRALIHGFIASVPLSMQGGLR